VSGPNRGAEYSLLRQLASRGSRAARREVTEMAKILLVEDEMLVRELAFEDLTDAGHEVTTAGTGDEALAILRQDSGFEVLFTDIRMPGVVDGWQLADQGKQLIPTLKVIYATGLNDDTGRIGPGEKLLAKPYRKDDLLKAVA
jgi:CheY-like chemotaxis protein